MAFKPGQSGNPSGAKVKSQAVRELVLFARDKCKKAIETANALLEDEDSDGKLKMQAATFLRDTGMGKPSNAEFDLAQVPDEELYAEVRRRAELARKREAAAHSVSSGVGAASLDG